MFLIVCVCICAKERVNIWARAKLFSTKSDYLVKKNLFLVVVEQLGDSLEQIWSFAFEKRKVM